MPFSYRHDDDEQKYSITGIAISNQTIIFVSTLGFGALGLILYLILRRLSANENDENQEHIPRRDVYGEMLDEADAATLTRAQRRAKARFRMKNARRAAVPVQAAEGAAAVEEEGGEGRDVRREHVEANLTRKERQMAAKAVEREERRVYAEQARLLREKKQSTIKSKVSSCDGQEKNVGLAKEKSLEEIFPRTTNVNDALSEILFYDHLVENIKQQAQSSDAIMSMVEQMPKITIREFIERLKEHGSVSITNLADEFGITVSQALNELDDMNKQHGVIGIPDSKGNFIYISMDMIEKAIHLGQEAGRVPCPHVLLSTYNHT